MPSDAKEGVNDDHLLNLTYLKNILSYLSASFPPHNNSDSSTVITSKFIKDPRLMRREKAMGKQNNTTGLNEILPFEKSLGYVNSEINLASMPTTSAPTSEVVPDDQAIFSDGLDAPRFKVSLDDSQSQTHNMDSKDYGCTPSNKTTLTGQFKDQANFSLPISLSNVVSEAESQKHSEEKAQRGQQRSTNTCTKEYNSHISQKLQSSNLKTVYQTGHQMSTAFPLQKKENIDEYIQNIGKMRNFTDPENNSKYEKRQTLWKETDNYFTNETKVSPIDNYILLHQAYKKGENLDTLGNKSDKTLITQEFEIPESFTSATKDKDELDHLASELQYNLTPSIENLSQKLTQHSLEYEDNFHTGFAIVQKLMELKLEKTNQNYVSVMTDAFQEAKDIPQARERLIDTVISPHDNSNCIITREHVCVHRKNENEPVSSENNQQDCQETLHIENGQDHSLFCNTQLNSDMCLNINFKEQGDNDKENQNEAKEENGASSSENNIENIYGDKKQDFYTNKNFTSVDERKNKNYNNVEILRILSSEEFSTTFNLMWGEKYVLTETSLLESKDTAVKQKDTQNTGEHLASTTFPQIAGSSVCLASNAAVQISGTTIPALSMNHEDQQRYPLKETCCSESPDFDLLAKHRVSDCKINMDKNKLQDPFQLSINEKSVLQNFELENEIEVGSEQCNDAFLFQQDAHGQGNVRCEVSGASYEALKSRIDWEGLFGSNYEEMEVLESPQRRENSDQHHCKESNFYSTQRNKTEFLNPVLLPDLQVTITDIFQPGFCPTADSLELKDNFGKCVTEAPEPEINKEEGKAPGFEIYSQPSGENSGYPCEDKFDKNRQESGLVSKSEHSHSFDLNHNIHVNHMSEKENSELFTKPSNVTINDESRCFSTKSKTNCNDTRSKEDMESRISKRKLCTLFEDQNISDKDLRQYEICEKKKKLTRQDSFACFTSLSQGRIKTFSRSEKHIRNVLDILNNEASLCKSKRISKKLDRAVLHLKKAHRRVHTSLQLVAKVGEKRKGPLPKSYAIICNNFWESCDLQDYSSVSERKYCTRHVLSKRKKHDNQGEKRALRLDFGKSLTHVAKHKSSKTNGERITKCLSKKSIASSVSRSHTTTQAREFCDQEQCPKSQLPLSSTSESTSQSTFNSSMENPRSSELQPFSRKTGCLFSSDHPDEKLTVKENQIDMKFLSNISKYEKLENHLAYNNVKDATKENNSEAHEVTNQSNSVSLSCIKKNNVSYSTDRNYDATCIAHPKVKTGIFISVLESNVRHFLNVDVCKRGNRILPGYKRNLEVNFPIQKWTASTEISKPSIITRNFLTGLLNLTLISGKKYSIPQLLSATPVTDNERESSKFYLDKQRNFALDCFATSTAISHLQRCSGKELLKTEQCSSINCFHVDGNETNVSENSELDLTSITEESKICGKNITKKLSPDDSSLLLKDNIKCSSIKCIAKKDIQDRKMWKVKQAEKTKDSVYKKSMTEGSTIKTEYKNQKNKILEESSHLNEKTIKSNLIDSHLSIKNTTTEAVYLNHTVSNQFNKREEREVKVSDDSQSNSTLHSEVACISKPVTLGVSCMPILHAASETSKVTPLQKKPTSHMNELKEEHCSANHMALIAKLSQILQRADEASSLQILQEETKVCQNILPLFVEAFERKQECSFEQILISRELLVEQNLWNNCKHKLKPCAVDPLVELQMMMETIQFIENKKSLLGGEPTFRSLLWYDETLYPELLGRPHGYQQQSSFYPAFQGRLKYNAFCELQNYHDQLIELFEETKRENNSYYAFLKYKRQINECEAIMKHCSDCFDFSLSVPFTCGVNFGDSLGDLETLRKSTLKLISVYGESPKVHSYPGKQDHLWVIIEIISSKVNFIKSNEAVSIKISLYGLEHIFFDAAKNLVWKERRQSFSREYSWKKNNKVLLKMNQCAFSKLQKIYDTLAKDLNGEPISSVGLVEDAMIASRKSDDLINKATISIENCSKFSSTLFSHPDICFISEILDQAELADIKKLQELTLRCTDHLEILKKYFQVLQEGNIDNIFITEENALDMMKNHKQGATMLKPAAIETYVEIVMVSETVHFLKNLMAKKLDKQRFRGMLWFDLSLLPELIHCQEKMAAFSFLKDNSTDCTWKVIETAISELKKDLDIIYKYNEAVNCSYALHLLSRELEELSEIKKLLKKSQYSFSTYIDFVPYIASINYGSTVTELEHNYYQFSTLLKNVMAAPCKDLGKVAHIVKVMKTIEHMKIICAKNSKLTISFILCQMQCNRRKTLQLKGKEKMNIHVIKPGEKVNKSITSVKVPSISESVIKNISNSSKKRRITVEKCENYQEQEKNTISTCKKPKVKMNDTTKINREKRTFKHPRTTGSHPKSENEIGSNRSSDNLKRNHASPKKIEMQRSLPGSLLPLQNLKDTSISKSESKIDITNILSDTSEHFTGHQENLTSMKKRNVNSSAAGTKCDKKDCNSLVICDQKSVDDTFSKDHEAPSHKFPKNSPDPIQKSCLSNIKPGTDASPELNASVCSKPIFCFVKNVHTNLEMNDTVLELQDNKTLNSSIKNSTFINSPEPIVVHNKIPVLQINKTQLAKTESEEKHMKDTLDSSTISFGASGSTTPIVNQTAQYSFSEQQNHENSKFLTLNAATYWNDNAQSVCTPIYNSSEHSFGISYPYYAWCVYHYSNSSGNAIIQTCQGMTSHEVQPPPGMLTTITSTVQDTHFTLPHTQYFGYSSGQPQANGFVPVNAYFQSQMPISYTFQQPVFSYYASAQSLPQAAYSYPPNPGVLPEVPWIYVPWQQEAFQPGH
ncbi:PREDICTED: testis-expressed sequence 15 protein [Galeopterus variegatus]|uniref:Testis-expressed sequence 15 protein n=1 Tax=Galeopterus variegatus TaxID=482537 RepID=A0ABM0S9F6_GALVR|nr:PREDICTED: testis-expressed sequence 15 protein [Galeopterus variegatus]